jgi:hypothetical protein
MNQSVHKIAISKEARNTASTPKKITKAQKNPTKFRIVKNDFSESFIGFWDSQLRILFKGIKIGKHATNTKKTQVI